MSEIMRSKINLGTSYPRQGKPTLTFFPDFEGTEEGETAQEIARNCLFASDHLLNLLDNDKEAISVKRETLETLSEFLQNVANELETLKEQGQDAEQAPESALHWAVYAETHGASVDHCGLMGAFYTKSDAEEYAARLDADTLHKWSVTVEEIA